MSIQLLKSNSVPISRWGLWIACRVNTHHSQTRAKFVLRSKYGCSATLNVRHHANSFLRATSVLILGCESLPTHRCLQLSNIRCCSRLTPANISNSEVRAHEHKEEGGGRFGLCELFVTPRSPVYVFTGWSYPNRTKASKGLGDAAVVRYGCGSPLR